MRSIPPLLGLLAGLVLVSCSGAGPTSNPQENGVELRVDASLTPPLGELPPLGGGPRPIAVLEDEDGSRAAFVANELWLATDDRALLDALLDRWNGTLLLEADPAASGVNGLPHQYLVRIDTTLADAGALSADLIALDPDSSGRGTVSSTEALGLLAAGAREAVDGHDVGINWIGEGSALTGQAIPDRVLAEAPSGGPALGGTAYAPNPFAWPTHDVGSPQDIGVAEAWRALESAGRLVPGSVKVAILDMGFEPDADTPTPFTSVSNVPFVAPTGTENLGDCGGPCPWHGTNVMSAAFALPGNGFGSAGSAGPVAEPVLVFTTYDTFTSVSALLAARLVGAKVANMSYSTSVPYYLAFTVLNFEAATAAVRASGTLLFAAAGNDGRNVDANKTLFGADLGFEKTWHAPCENAGVLCVGGVSPNSLSRASASNHGAEQVDLFAPFTLWLGPDPDAPDNVVRAKSGTSFSSPFAAGVAALVWAADPSLGAGEVEDILFDSAKSSPDGEVGRIVDALGAVQAALGNIPPTVDVTRPRPGDEIHLNETVFFDAVVADFEDGAGCCEVAWTSDPGSALGSGRAVSGVFASVGPRTVTVTATDSGGGRTRVDVPVTVVNDPPRVDITRPVSGDEIFRGVSTVVRGTSFDRNEAGASLDCGALVWTSSDPADAGFPVLGCDVQVAFATLGTRTLTLTGTDPQGAAAGDAVTVNVLEPPVNLPPSVLITSPANLQSVGTDEEITLSGDVSDPEGSDPLTLVWTVSVNGGAPAQVGSGNDVPWTPSDSIDFGGEDRFDVTIRLTAEDPEGNGGGDAVLLRFIIVN